MNEYSEFIRALINSAIESGDMELGTKEIFKTYCKIVKMDYIEVIQKIYHNWNGE